MKLITAVRRARRLLRVVVVCTLTIYLALDVVALGWALSRDDWSAIGSTVGSAAFLVWPLRAWLRGDP